MKNTSNPSQAGHHFERGVHRNVVEKRMTAEPSVLEGVGVFPTLPANYQAGSLNSKQPVLTLAGEICSFILKVSICRNNWCCFLAK